MKTKGIFVYALEQNLKECMYNSEIAKSNFIFLRKTSFSYQDHLLVSYIQPSCVIEKASNIQISKNKPSTY